MAAIICWSTLACEVQAQAKAHAQAQTQTVDTASRLAASYFKEAAAAGRNQHIWPIPIYGHMLFVDPDSRVTYSNMPDSAGILKPGNRIYKGVLPKEVMIANTAIQWQGERWSVILWPLPTGHDDRVNLMMHESFHRIQGKLGLPERSPTADHLSRMYGRIYYLLELQALKAALQKPVNQRDADLTNALLFREKRQQLFPGTFGNERILEMSEGLAEYTGVILGRQKDSILPHLYQQIDSAGERKSLIRSFAYTTGPVYGYLLYEKSPGWTQQADSNASFPALVAKVYQIRQPQLPDSAALAALAQQYNGNVIVRSEESKEQQRLQTVNQYTDLFTHRPVLTIDLIKMGIGFNPSNLFDLGEYGTIYPTAQVKDTWGQLTVLPPGMLMKDWQVITLSASEGISVNGQVLEGKGWKLMLNDDWKLVKTDSLHYRLSH
jgi:hypothetical protein